MTRKRHLLFMFQVDVGAGNCRHISKAMDLRFAQVHCTHHTLKQRAAQPRRSSSASTMMRNAFTRA